MNIVELIKAQAKKNPYKKAVIFPNGRDLYRRYTYTHYTYESIEDDAEALAYSFRKLGVEKGDLVLLFVKPSLEFPLVVFALFKIGAIPVMIDPGMGKTNLLTAITEVKPKLLIAEPVVHGMRRLYPEAFKTVKTTITTGRYSFSTKSLRSLLKKGRRYASNPFPTFAAKSDDLAAILFTSGGTGKPKGVCYTHGIFATQIRLLKQLFAMNEHDVDMPGFPLFCLMTMAMGVTSVIPPMNPSKPSKCDPKKLYEVIRDQGVTTMGGSPAIWERLAAHCKKGELKLPSVKHLMMFGAPVPPRILADFQQILVNGKTHTPYGATECLPVTTIGGDEVIEKTLHQSKEGKGTCVGYPAPETEVRVIAQTNHPIEDINGCRILEPGQIGEIIVAGKQVTPRYFELETQTALAKIKDHETGRLWHRMGDLGYFDAQGMLWFCGRKAHQITGEAAPYYSVPCEAIFNQHPDVKRTALISLGANDHGAKPALVVERKDQKCCLRRKKKQMFRDELLTLAKSYQHTKAIDTFFLHKSFPVDPRHNIKIDRSALGEHFKQHQDLSL
ncbi:MAG: AMP-binding protein [Oligoflexales bacterium]|nr:AMP-binding protein [Oligoflexales bacterium]